MRLVLDRDAGGPRHYLAGRPVHCGDSLDLLLPGGVWARVRFELEPAAPSWCAVPVFYMPLGGEWESWTPPPGVREGDEVQVPCDRCRESCGESCLYCDDTGVRFVMVQRPGPSSVVLRDVDAAELRWPDEVQRHLHPAAQVQVSPRLFTAAEAHRLAWESAGCDRIGTHAEPASARGPSDMTRSTTPPA